MRDFNHTVNVLVKAYLNNTLEHCNCHACAVGNLVAEANNIRLTKNTSGGINWRSGSPWWFDAMLEGRVIYDSSYYERSKEQCETTGYTIEELARIEAAFEKDFSIGQDPFDDGLMFNGLMAVVDVLAEIHGIDLTAKEEAKALFVKAS